MPARARDCLEWRPFRWAAALLANIRLGWKGLIVFGPSMPVEVILMFAGKARRLPRVEHMQGALFR